MTLPLAPIRDARKPCRHCGRLCKPTGVKHHEHSCAQNPDRAPAPASAWSCVICGVSGPPSHADPARCPRCVRAGADPEPTPRQPVTVAPAPTIVCSSCEREGTPSRGVDPTRCVACGISEETAAERRRMLPPRSAQSQAALDILARSEDPALKTPARKLYVRARAVDFALFSFR